MIFSEYVPYWRQALNIERQNEIILMMKKPLSYDCKKEINAPDAAKIDKLEIGKDGAVRTFLEGHPEAIRSYPDVQTVGITAIYKRLVPLFIKSFSQQNVFIKVITLLAVKYNWKHILPEWFDYIFTLFPCLLKEQYYSQPVREIRRVLKGKLPQGLFEAITLVLEYDSAYRFILQDIIVEMDKSKLDFNYNVRKEIGRLFDILSKRDPRGDGGQSKKFNKMKRMVNIVLWLSPKLNTEIKYILKELNIDELRMSKEDIYCTNEWGVYNYRGITYQQRRNENRIKYGGV